MSTTTWVIAHSQLVLHGWQWPAWTVPALITCWEEKDFAQTPRSIALGAHFEPAVAQPN